MKDALMQIKEAALEAIKAQDDLDKINDLRVKYLGKKGELTAILKGMGKLSKEERPVIGELANTVRDAISQALEEKSEELRAKALEAKLAGETLDVTLPGTSMPQGHLHPLTQVVNDAKRIFTGLGFEVAEGPEIESDYYNFEALNLPPDHPARDMQDTFYINDKVVLRTQTSGVQVHAMEKMNGKLPVKIIARAVCIAATMTRPTARCSTRSKGSWSTSTSRWPISRACSWRLRVKCLARM